jgi:hypothetical protein
LKVVCDSVLKGAVLAVCTLLSDNAHNPAAVMFSLLARPDLQCSICWLALTYNVAQISVATASINMKTSQPSSRLLPLSDSRQGVEGIHLRAHTHFGVAPSF